MSFYINSSTKKSVLSRHKQVDVTVVSASQVHQMSCDLRLCPQT